MSGYNTYVGARYVPIFDGEWDKNKSYEPLTIVSNEGNSYTSRTFVPTGVSITNETYWALTGNYNAQVEYYRRETAEVKSDLDELKTNVTNKSYFITPEMFGAKGDGVTDDSEAIQNAVNYASEHLIPLIFSGKTYLLGTKKDFIIRVKSNSILIGNNTTITIPNNFVTDTYFNLFGNDATTKVENVRFEGFIFDLNGSNNLVTTLTQRSIAQASIKFLSTSCKNINVYNCVFKNCTGLHYVYISGENAKVINCEFYNCGGSITGNTANNDFTCVFLASKYGLVENCIFKNDLTVSETGVGGGNTGVELHCEDGKINNCDFIKFKQSVITDNDREQISAYNNLISNCYFNGINAIDVWTEKTNECSINVDNCVIICIEDGRAIYSENIKGYAPKLTITNSVIKHTDTTQNLLSLHNYSNVKIINSVLSDCNNAIHISDGNLTEAYTLNVTNCEFNNCVNGIYEAAGSLENIFSIISNTFSNISGVDIVVNRLNINSKIISNSHSTTCTKCISNSEVSACYINEIFTKELTDLYGANNSVVKYDKTYTTFGRNVSVIWTPMPYTYCDSFTYTIQQGGAFELTTDNIPLKRPIEITKQCISVSTGNSDIIATPLYENNSYFKVKLVSTKAFTGTIRIRYTVNGN